MRGKLLGVLVPSALIVLGATAAFAFIEPTGDRLTDFDGRLARRGEPKPVSTEQLAAASELRTRLPKVRVDFDGLTGAPRTVSAGDGFLTSSIVQSQNQAVSSTATSTAVAATVVATDPDSPVRTFLQEHRNLFGHGPEALDQARVVRAYVTPHNGMRTVVWQQQVDDIPVFESVLVAHTTKRGELINLSSDFVPDPVQAANAGTSNRAAMVAIPPMTDRAAVVAAARNLGESIAEPEVQIVQGEAAGAEKKQMFQAQALPGQTSASLVWLPMGREEFRLCWDVVLTSRSRGEMFRVLVDAQTGEVLLRRGLTRYISDASYRVYTSDSPSPFSPGHSTPLTTQPALTSRILVTLPAMDTNASPNGWINDGVNQTMGNNVDAHTDRDNNDSPDLPRPAGSPFRVFDFAMDPATQDPINYSNAAVVQLFYLCNWYHDRLYELGFTEAAGNFQVNNFGRGGVGNDAVQADAQDGGGVNNANFSTPPDGSPGRMQMYIFSGPSPRRDGDLDAEIVFHEFTHGLSWRLVGGGQALGTSQSDGMGEGWSDFYGLTLLSEPGDNVNGCYAAGGYATYLFSGLTANYYYGIRRYPYSTDMTKNPLTFKDIDSGQASPHNGIPRSPVIGNTAAEVHNQGEVWCVTLWEARANLINKLGWAVGNELMLQLVTDGMKLTPGQPNFLQARDGILQADLVNTGGANRNELWAAFAKRGMGISATSPSSTTTAGVFEAYDVPDDLFIFPTLVLTSGGPVGGPFSPNPASFVLTNTGSAPLNWSLMNTSTWVTVLPASGTLLPGGPATTVSVTIEAVANTFSLGAYTADVSFSNETSGVVQARPFRLNIVGGSMFDDFDPDIDLTQWSDFGGTVGSTILANSYGGFISAPNSLWFGEAGSRYATTVPIDASGGGSISFWLRLGSGASPWENVDLPGEGVVLEYSTDGGGNWANIATCNTATFYSWTQVSNNIPVGAQTANTLFRWRQLSNSGMGFDHWALDDVMIDATPASTLALSIPVAAAEGDAPQTGTVTVSPAPANDLTVTLNSSDVSEVTVPSSVLVLAGNTDATFDLTIVDDVDLDGPQTANITASAPAHQGANAVITVADNETAMLGLSLPINTSESSGTVTGIVSVSTAPAANILVSLSSSDTTELVVPATIMLPAGQTSAAFIATVVNDTLIDGPQNVTVTAQVPNWTDGLDSITVLDNETLNLTVSLPATAYENSGVLVGAGQVRLSGSLPTNLVVSLLSSDTTEAIVSATTTIFAGQTNGAFNLTMVDDGDVDGAQPVRITASAAGFNSGSNTVTVLDDESPPLPANPSPLNWATNVAANTSLTWSNGMAGVTNDVYFGTVAGAGQLQYLGSTTGTNWTLPLLAPNTTYYWRIVVNRVGTTIGPVWRFTTRGVDHFVWGSVPSPQYVNTSFATQITAKDEFGTTVSNFTGTVSLNGSSGGGQTTNTILGNVTHTTSSTGNYTLAYAITPNTNLTVTHVRSYSGSKVSIWSDAGTLLASQNVSGPGGTWTETPLATALTLTNGTTYRVSFYINGGTYYYRSDRPATFPNGTLVNGYYYRTGDGFPDTFYNSDKVIFLCDLRYTTAGSLAVPITPIVSGPFVNGAWTGNVAVLAPKSGLTLRAADGSSHLGLSNPFEVLLANDVAVAVSDAPDPVSVGGNLTYAISVTNLGPASAAGVIVTNVLPASTTIVSVTPSQGTTTTNGNVLVCNLGSMAGNTSATVAIVARVNSVGTISNLTTVSRSDVDAYLPNNSATTLTTVGSPAISISDVSLYEGNVGVTTAAFAVTVVPPPAAPVSVNFATFSGSATASSDFLGTNGVLNFAVGQTNKTIFVTVLGDAFFEDIETFTVNLSGVVNASLNDGQAIGTILNDDPMPTLSIGDRSLAEGNAGTTNAVFPVTLSAASGISVTVNYATASGNATSGSDYASRSGSLIIPAGTTTSNVVITVNGDLQIESDEVFYVDLSSAANAILLKREGVGLIINDDGLPGQLDHFAWSAFAPTQYVGVPFGATIMALDYFNSPVTGFNGVANLSGAAGGGAGTNTILGSIVPDINSSGSFTLGYSFTPNTNLTVTHVRSYSGTKVSIWTDAGALLASQNVNGTAGTWTETPLSAPLALSAGSTYRVAFYSGNGSYYWRNDGLSTFAYGTINQGYEGSGDVFPNTTDSVRWWFVDLRYTINPGGSTPITPTVTGSFSSGIWTGNIAALASATNLVLRVDDGNMHSGVSTPMMVELRNDIALAVTDNPDPVSVGGNVSYLITVTNVGPAAATGVVVTNLLPTTVTAGTVTSSQGNNTTNGNTIISSLGTLAANASATIAIIGTTTTIGYITNVATVYRAEPDAFLGNNSAATVTSVVVPALSINSVSLAEGNSGMTPLVFTVSLSAPPATNVTVNFATTNVSAVAGSDYLATNGILNFATGQTNLSFVVQILGDTNTESSETFLVTLSNPVNAALGAGVGTGMILNDDVLGRVAVFGAPGLDSWNEDVRQKVANAGNFLQVDAFLARTGYPVPTLTQLQQYAAVLVYSDSAFNDNIGLGDVLADYIDAGGGVVLCTFGFHSSGSLSIQGRIKTAGYLPFSTAAQNWGSTLALIADLPSHPILNGVSSFNGGSSSYHNSSISIANGATLVAHWSNGQPLVGAKEISPGRIVGLNFYPPSSAVSSDFWNTNTQGGLLMANALGWAAQAMPGTNPPVISQQPSSQTTYVSGTATFTVAASGSPLSYHWCKDGVGIAGATNASHVISGAQTNDAGNYSVIVANAYGAVTSSVVTLTVIDLPVSAEFRIVALTPNNSSVVDHDVLTGDDRGGIAASSSQVFYSGDNATARFSLANLSGGVGLGRVYNGMVSDLRTEQMYHLANGTNLLTGSGTVTTLVELNGTTGLPTGNIIPLSTPVIMASDSGIFAGYGRAVLHNGTRVYEVMLPSGLVVDRGTMAMPAHMVTENWAFWGVAENYGGSIYLVYVQNSQTISRTLVPTGVTTPLGTFSNLSDMACLTVSILRNRWYFHYEGSGQFGGSSETVGYADAVFNLTGTTNPPVILTQPVDQTVAVGGPVTFSVLASGSSPLSYQWWQNGTPIGAATNDTYTMNPVQYSNAGIYSVVISNTYGFMNSSNATLTVLPPSTNLTFYAFDTGWYDASGTHNAGNANYLGGKANSNTYRNWFAFNVPMLPGQVIAATLRINTYEIVSPSASETYQLRHVSTPVPTLVAGGSGLTAIYNDLGDGVVYGIRDYSTAESDQYITMALNPDFITNLVAAAGQPFAVGGEVISLDGNPSTTEYVFGSSYGNSTDVQLILALGSAPAPLRFLSSGLVSGDVHFWLGTTDGSPIAADRAARIQIYSTTNLTDWLPMTYNPVLTNGLLWIQVSDLTNSPIQFWRAKETP